MVPNKFAYVDSLEDHGTFLALAVRENHVYTVHAKWIPVRALGARSTRSALRWWLIFFPFAFFEGLQIIENVMPYLLQIFGDLRGWVFFLEFLNHAVHQHRSGFLLQVTHFTG